MDNNSLHYRLLVLRESTRLNPMDIIKLKKIARRDLAESLMAEYTMRKKVWEKNNIENCQKYGEGLSVSEFCELTLEKEVYFKLEKRHKRVRAK